MPTSLALATLVAVLGGEPEDADVIADRIGPVPLDPSGAGQVLAIAQEVVGEAKARRWSLRYGREDQPS